MKKSILILLGVFTLTFSAKAQDNIEALLLASPNDATKLIQGYFNPAMKGFIYSMNSGWYHTAKVHKVLGFDLQIGLSASMVPSEDEIFSLAGLTSVSGASSAPTFAGKDVKTPLVVTRTLSVNGQSTQVSANFSMPEGKSSSLPLNALPAPAVQFNIGLPFKTEAMVRYFPETSIGGDNSKAKMYGIGIKKEITSWFGPLDKLPLHVSLLGAYTSMDVNYGIANVTTGPIQTNGAGAEFSLKAYTVQAIASLNFPFINVYGGIGYSGGTSTLKMNGRYAGVYSYATPGGGTATTTENLTTPNDMKFDANGIKTTIGARISLLFFKIYADYTLQEYNTLNLGFAFSIR